MRGDEVDVMDARSELLTYMGAALVTIVVLFGAQIWYATYLDTHVVNVHPLDAPADEKREAFREQERAKLSSGKMPIAQAKAQLAQRGRTAFPTVAPRASEDLSAMSGWMHRPGFKPYTPRAAAASPGQGGNEVAPAADPSAEAAPAEGVGAVAEAGQKPALVDDRPVAPEAPAQRRPARVAPRAPAPVVQGTPAAPPVAGQ
jgi:hypothetical protein